MTTTQAAVIDALIRDINHKLAGPSFPGRQHMIKKLAAQLLREWTAAQEEA